MIEIHDNKECCGCSACANVCSHQAITMKPDTLGFLYPKVDVSMCINCGLCEKVCSFNKNYETCLNLEEPIAYAARHKDVNEIETSRSGAAFIAISDFILENGGVVYGAGFTDNFKVVHKRATTKTERNEFKGSKYVQSDTSNIFHKVKKDLQNGLMVLFSGTPCQTAGLNSFIGKNIKDKLILVDIVCHGVPSPYIWRDYIKFIERKYKDQISYVNFRNKQLFGWSAHYETFELKNKGLISSNSFTFLFYKHIFLRKSCEICPYTNLKRPSDITLADFWGWEKSVPNFNIDNKGVSLLIINTEKGINIFNSVKNRMNVKSVDINNCLQGNLISPSVADPLREEFELDYKRKGFKYVYYKYGKDGYRYKLLSFIKKIKNKLMIK